MIKPPPISGFTLLEFLLYLSIAAVVLMGVATLLSISLEIRSKHHVIAEVESQATAATSLINQSIHQASAIQNLTPGGSAAELGLYFADDPDDPIIFDVVGGQLRLTEEEAEEAVVTPLTNSHVMVTGLIFQNLSRPGTPDTIHYQFTLTAVNPSGRSETDFTKTFTTSASLRL